ncbi:hypothetical protein D3H35_01070 [Cohnella faecalis]|uniref:Uncharacterized protein n=1 Tax=Cohnella faecalis TaxID=2315694 RepID=A0A398CRV5_9BACL|nr:hypothetical protein D3H35_01070 [Cohnella faecalis]
MPISMLRPQASSSLCWNKRTNSRHIRRSQPSTMRKTDTRSKPETPPDKPDKPDKSRKKQRATRLRCTCLIGTAMWRL